MEELEKEARLVKLVFPASMQKIPERQGLARGPDGHISWVAVHCQLEDRVTFWPLQPHACLDLLLSSLYQGIPEPPVGEDMDTYYYLGNLFIKTLLT